MAAEPLALALVRAGIDGIDDALVLLLAARGRLARSTAALKRAAGRPGRDLRREAQVHRRTQALAARIGLPAATARAMTEVAIGHGCRQQGLAGPADERAGFAGRLFEVGDRRRADLDQVGDPAGAGMILPAMPTSTDSDFRPAPQRLLRLLPPPARLAPLLRAAPAGPRERVLGRLLEPAMSRVLAVPLARGELGFMGGRRLGIEVTDLGLGWVVSRDGDRLVAGPGPAEASVRGTVTDLLLLASRLEDADTLFFQRRLVLTGDTELGLHARNLLERLPWDTVPLGLRIALNRGARLARAARAAHRGDAAP